MEYKLWQYPRGANKGGVLNIDISPTISTSSWENNCLLIEIYEQENICDSPPAKDEGQDSGGYLWQTLVVSFPASQNRKSVRCEVATPTIQTRERKVTDDINND